MLGRRIRRLRAVQSFVLCLWLVSCLFTLVTVRLQPAKGQTVCTQSATSEIALDDGFALDQALPGIGGCHSCTVWQGVKFTLPEGLTTAVVKATRVYAGGGKGTLVAYVTDEKGDFVSAGVTFLVNGTQWYTVTLPDVVVGNQFWIFIQRTGGGLLQTAVEPFYDSRRDGTSAYGESPARLFGKPPGDFMIRAVIVPEVRVGPGQDYETIQEAVDSVWEGWTIAVDEGTYNENVTVDKSVIIKSVSGPAKTIVQTSPSRPDNNVFTITAGCVALSGFTIQSATYTGRAGVRIENASGCSVYGNVIQNNDYGIYVSEDSAANILLENECKYNAIGIHMDGSENYIHGNNLRGNTAPVGSAVFLSAFGSGNQLRFNTITVEPGTDPNVAASAQAYNQSSTGEVSAIENWWGTATGPANAGGQGPLLGDNIRFDPWLTKQPLRVKTLPTVAGGYTVNAMVEMDVTVLKQGTGTPVVSAASFGENPFGEFPGKPMGKWVDVLFDSSDGVDQVEIRLFYTSEELGALDMKEGSLRFFYWNGEKWQKCSKTGVDKENDYAWARLNLKTKPTPSDLTGTMFAVGVPKSSFAWWLIPVIIVIVLLLLIFIRLVWILLARRGGGYTSID